MRRVLLQLLLAGVLCGRAVAARPLSPVDLDWDPGSKQLFITTSTGCRVLVLDTAMRAVVRSIPLPSKLSATAVSRDGGTLYVTGGGADGKVFAVDAADGTIRRTIGVGHTPVAPTLSPDGNTLYVCNQFDDNVAVVDLTAGKVDARIPVVREPAAADLTPDGKFLFVANLLPDGPANVDTVACKVSAIDTATRKVTHIPLVNGAEGVRGLRVSPDGTTVFVTSILARFHVPTTQLARGWVATDALSVIRVADLSLQHTVLLDDVDRGFPNPWAIAFSDDGKTLLVSAAGTHELSLIDLPAMAEELAKQTRDAGQPAPYNDLAFLAGIRKRVPLKGNGPRAIVTRGATAYVANHFTDSIDCVAGDDPRASAVTTIALNPGLEIDQTRQGEIIFNDATRCFQNWLSCATCHPDARADALNWDLLNDGMGNPKNVKSLLLTHRTPPTTWLGARPNAMTSVRAGVRHIQFSIREEKDTLAVDAYLKALKPEPSPYLAEGKLSAAAKRGKRLFKARGCAQCHPAPLFTDRKPHDVGTTTGPDTGRPVDTPSLVEVWRTAPYLHDGRAATMRALLTTHGHSEILKQTADLSKQELTDLETYVLSIPGEVMEAGEE